MTLRKIREQLGAVFLVDVYDGSSELDIQLPSVIASDIMSDVLSFSESGCLLLTGQINKQTARTAEMAEIRAVCFVYGKQPADETMILARENGLMLLSTPLSMYEACVNLHIAGMEGCKGKNGR